VPSYPQHDRHMIDPQNPPNPAVVHAITVQSDRLLAHFIGVTVGFGLWRVATLAVPAAIALTACCRSPRFHLVIFGLAIGTWFHSSSLPISTYFTTPEVYSEMGAERLNLGTREIEVNPCPQNENG
jgi:hypothetical protein